MASTSSVTLLGTSAGPMPGPRMQTASVLEVNGHLYIVDAGNGLTQNFWRAGFDFGKLRAIFVTHMHSDHYSDLFNFLSANWTNWDMDRQHVRVLGPPSIAEEDAGWAEMREPGTQIIHRTQPAGGLDQHMEKIVEAFATDLNIRIHSTRRRDDKPVDFVGSQSRGMYSCETIDVVDGMCDGQVFPVVYDDGNVTVRATLVQHPPVYPSFGFRFDWDGGSAVFSGDTAPSANLVALSRGASALIHEVQDLDHSIRAFSGTAFAQGMMRQFLSAHTPSRSVVDEARGVTVPGVGAVATDAGVSALILNHIYPSDGSVPDEDFRRDAASEFEGEIWVGKDLDRIDIPLRRSI